MGSPVKVNAIVMEIVHHTEILASVKFKTIGRTPRFSPGQFLHLSLEKYDPTTIWPESRAFSIQSSPTSVGIIEITFSVKGTFTMKMFDILRPGVEVSIKLPYGDFIINQQCDNIVLIAGGTGITPFLSFILQCIEKKYDKNIFLYYGIRDKSCFLFKNILDKASETLPNFKLKIYSEAPFPSAQRTTVLDIKEIFYEVPLESEFYLSGPSSMVKSFHNWLIEQEVSLRKIKFDQWE